MKLLNICTIVSLTTVTACSGILPPPEVITSRGVPSKITAGSLPEGPDSLPQMFRNDVAAAAHLRSEESIRNMIRSGAMIIRGNCRRYFSEKGSGQQRSRVMRAGVAPVSAVLTGALGLINMGESEREDLLQVLAIGSSAGAAGLDIYDQHFLFDADNIAGVETLTLGAIATHRDLAIKQKELTFQDGIQHLMDIQAICAPAHILMLVRGSIESSKLVDQKTGKTANETRNNSEKGPINVRPASGKTVDPEADPEDEG